MGFKKTAALFCLVFITGQALPSFSFAAIDSSVEAKSELSKVTRQIRAAESEHKKLREKAKKLEQQVDPRLLTAFKRIRKNARNGLAVVYIQRGACGGCFNKIPPQRQLDIKMHKKIIVCEYCGRIMIDPELAGVQE